MNRKRLIIIGIGGASCSGKTLLAMHIRNVLPRGCSILHQDDFAPPIDQVPFSPQHPSLQDWDDPPTCIQWDLFLSSIQHIRLHGSPPLSHISLNHLNKQSEIGIDTTIFEHCKLEMKRIQSEEASRGVDIVWAIVDGFVLFWNQEVVDLLDVRLMMKVPYNVLKERREERQVYVLQNPDDASAGGVWVDPPNYFDNIVYPAYVKSHEHLFDGGDVENGELSEAWDYGAKDLRIISPLHGEQGMTEGFAQACTAMVEAVRAGAGTYL